MRAILKAVTGFLWKEEVAATMVEYGIMLAFIAAICIAAITAIGAGTNPMFQSIAGSL